MPTTDKQFQREIKKIWTLTRKRLKVVGDEALVLARRGEEEVSRAAKIGRLQLNVLSTKRKQDRVHQEIGRRIVDLNRKEKLNIPGLKSQITRSMALSRQIRSQERALKRARATSRRRRSKRRTRG